MKKTLTLLLAAMLLPLAMGAQALMMDLQPNQRLLGHYTTDDVAASNGWGKPSIAGVVPISTVLTADELSFFQDGKIVAFRIGLTQSTPVTRVFVTPVAANGVEGETTEWPCNVSDVGWNMVVLDNPYVINLASDAQLRIGFDYAQTTTNKPISMVQVGTVYPTYCFYNNTWRDYGASQKGNLSMQCIVENDNFPEFLIRLRNLKTKDLIKVGDNLQYTFESCRFGNVPIAAGACTYDVAIDGNHVAYINNPQQLTDTYTQITGNVPTDGLSEGAHTLTVTVATVNGEALPNPASVSYNFNTFVHGYTRQMHLVEQFTSTGCTYCPQGTSHLQDLCDLRGDIAWVAVHENMNNNDPFRTLQNDTITKMQGCDGFPEASFDRSVGLAGAAELCYVITNASPTTMSNFLDYIDETPAWASVNISSTFDAETRQAVITVEGEMVPEFNDIMGANCKLTVYLTEDGLVAPQVSGGNNYVHNNVLRISFGSASGVNINRTGDTYKNEFNINIPSNWNADNMHIVAFIGRPLRFNALTDVYVTNTNKRKLGEFDEPTFIRGDVDGNTTVNITDVTALINYLLTSNATDLDLNAADCDESGTVNISDVTALINYLLSGNW